MASAYLRRLTTFDTVTPLSLETRGPGVYEEPFLIEGNSILSSVFVHSLDPGASLTVEYWDSTTGTDEGEYYQLDAHPALTSPTTNRLTVTRIHNKPNLRATVTGGSVRFGVYITVVSSFASDLDAALQYEGDPVQIDRNKGIPITAYETTTDEWSFLRTLNGRLQIDVPGVLQVSQQTVNFRRYNASLALLPGVPTEHINYTIPSGKRLFWSAGRGSANTWCSWEVEIDGARWLLARNAFDQPDVELTIGQPVVLSAGQNIIIRVENLSPFSTAGVVESWLFGALEDV